jgi:hypothetical protein
MKWAGISIPEFAHLVGLDKLPYIVWSDFANSTALLRQAASPSHERTYRTRLEKWNETLEDDDEFTKCSRCWRGTA